MKPGDRLNFHALRCVKHSTYIREIRHAGGTETALIHRYAFACTGDYVDDLSIVTSVRADFRLREGDLVSIRGTVHTIRDKYGFCRLKRVKIIPMANRYGQMELGL